MTSVSLSPPISLSERPFRAILFYLFLVHVLVWAFSNHMTPKILQIILLASCLPLLSALYTVEKIFLLTHFDQVTLQCLDW